MTVSAVLRTQRVVWGNATSLYGTTVIGATLGFVFWWAVAQYFPPALVGYGSAATTAMVLVGNLGALGISTVVMGELASRSRAAAPVAVAGVWAAVVVSTALGLATALFALRLIGGFTPDPTLQALFVIGAVLTAAAFVLDAAAVGLLTGTVQLTRNVVFHVVKLGALVLIGMYAAERATAEIALAWVVGVAASVVWAVAMLARRGVRLSCRPDRSFLRTLPRAASAHNGVNLGLEVAQSAVPIVATAVVSATAGASFYAAWMILSFAFVLPFHLGTALFAAGRGRPATLRRRLRFSVGLCGAAGLVGIPTLILIAPVALRLFGPSYAELGTTSLRLLALAYFPMIVWAHFVAVCRIRGRIGFAAAVVLAGSVLEIAAAAVGATQGGLVGLSVGLLAVKCLEGLVAAPTVWRELHAGVPTEQPIEERPVGGPG